MSLAAWSREEFEAQLRTQGRAYHIHHPFNVLMNAGAASPEQIRGWVANRFYYQINIPIKDAAILSNCPDRDVRRSWVQRILDHDGYGEDPGGIESWLRLAGAGGAARGAGGALGEVPAGGAIRGGRLRELRTPRALAGGRVFLADRAVRAGDPQAASRELAAALSLDRPCRARVLSKPGQSGGPRCRIQPGRHSGPL